MAGYLEVVHSAEPAAYALLALVSIFLLFISLILLRAALSDELGVVTHREIMHATACHFHHHYLRLYCLVLIRYIR